MRSTPTLFTPAKLLVAGLAALLALLGWLALSPAQAGRAEAPYRSPSMSGMQPGNYCVSCHTPGDPRLAAAMDWRGSIEREVISPCAAASRVHEEVYYTDRLLLAMARARTEIPAGPEAGGADARLAANRQSYSRLLDAPADSLEATTAAAGVLRYRLGKNYNWLNTARDLAKQQAVLLAALGVTVLVLVSLGWGWRNIDRYSLKSKLPAAGKKRFPVSFKAILFVVLLFALFSLPIFRTPAQEPAVASEAEQARQTALDFAGRVADVSDQALARSWMLARVGAAWAKVNPSQAENALAAALAAAGETHLNAGALWGEAQAAYEGAIGSPAAEEEAGLVASQVTAAAGRAWALRLIAAEWAAVDPARAGEILQEALALTSGRSGLYRELDVRGIAVTWARIDPDKALAVSERIYDPALRAWALWEIAEITGDASLYGQAADLARQVDEPVAKARLLREIALRSGENALFDEALAALAGVDGAAQAYALSDLAAAAGDAALAGRIEPAYPDARAAALYRLGRYEPAWAAAAAIADPLDRAHAQAAIAGAWGNVAAANEIADPTFRDLARRDIAVANNDVSLAGGIESAYYRVQALTALGQYQAAFEAAAGLSDTYPLRGLAVAWAASDPQAALAVVELMDQEADKAEALRAIAGATGDDATFERALSLALAARVRGNALAPAEASLELAHAFNDGDLVKAEAAFSQAFDIAGRISTRYK
ncbi:MAG: hypothetical protein AB1801_02650 [Chloroflexota bacterium]